MKNFSLIYLLLFLILSLCVLLYFQTESIERKVLSIGANYSSKDTIPQVLIHDTVYLTIEKHELDTIPLKK